MKKKNTFIDSKLKESETGQILIVVAFAFVALIMFTGLVFDLGRVFQARQKLYSATDAAVLAAAGQIREGRSSNQLSAIARETMALNGMIPDTIVIETCETAIVPNDSALCKTPRRKLIRITSDASIPMTFISVVGIHYVAITANAIGEAASMDVVLVIDISESMTWDADAGTPEMKDPFQCNAADPGGADGYPGECLPFEEVKRAAVGFANQILDKTIVEEEDRLAIVTFANGWSSDPNVGTHYRTTGWTSDITEAENIIKNLKVFEPGVCVDEFGSIQTYYGACRYYDYSSGSPVFQYFDCFACVDATPIDWSTLTSTNIGGGLLLAGNIFALQTREASLWVVVLLTDGMANATVMDAADDLTDFATYPIGYCPNEGTYPLCQDEDVTTRHADISSSYDADDYARNIADFVGCMPVAPAAACGGQTGQGAVIFTIGLGSGVLDNTNEIGPDGIPPGMPGDTLDARPYGASLLRYIAAVGYDGNPATDPCASKTDYTDWCGNYYFSPTGPLLKRVFEAIASRIFTRITH